MTITILGCGWLGLPLGKHLAKGGFTVKGSTTQSSKLAMLKGAGIQPYHLSFDPELKGEERDFFETDILLINLPPRNKDGIDDYHERQLQSIRDLATNKVRRVIFISSTSVYPSNNKEVTEEDADPNAVSRGGIPLLKMEQIFTDSKNFETTVIRFGGLYGPDRHPGRFLAGRKDLPGGSNPVNMIHLEDCIGVITTVIEKNLLGEIFNACSPSHETKKSFYQKAANELGVEPPTFNNEPASFKKVNTEKLITLTGYQFRYL